MTKSIEEYLAIADQHTEAGHRLASQTIRELAQELEAATNRIDRLERDNKGIAARRDEYFLVKAERDSLLERLAATQREEIAVRQKLEAAKAEIARQVEQNYTLACGIENMNALRAKLAALEKQE